MLLLGPSAGTDTHCMIDFFARIGWAYDLKSVSDELIRKRVLRTGDGTHQYNEQELQARMVDYVNQLDHESEQAVWGWDDKDMNEQDRQDATVRNKAD